MYQTIRSKIYDSDCSENRRASVWNYCVVKVPRFVKYHTQDEKGKLEV